MHAGQSQNSGRSSLLPPRWPPGRRYARPCGRAGPLRWGLPGAGPFSYGALLPFGLGLTLGPACGLLCRLRGRGCAGAPVPRVRGVFAGQPLPALRRGGGRGSPVAAGRRLRPALLAGCGRWCWEASASRWRPGGAGSPGVLLRGRCPAGGRRSAMRCAIPARKARHGRRCWRPLPWRRRWAGCARPRLPWGSWPVPRWMLPSAAGGREPALAFAAVTGAALCAADPSLAPAAAGLCLRHGSGGAAGPGTAGGDPCRLCGGVCAGGALRPAAWQRLLALLLSAGAGPGGCPPAARLAGAGAGRHPTQPGGAAPRFHAAATRLEAVAQSLSSLAETVNAGLRCACPAACETASAGSYDTCTTAFASTAGGGRAAGSRSTPPRWTGMEALRPILEQNGSLEAGAIARATVPLHPPGGAVRGGEAQLCALPQPQGSPHPLRGHAHRPDRAVQRRSRCAGRARASSWAAPATRSPINPAGWRSSSPGLGTPPLECAVTLDDLGPHPCRRHPAAHPVQPRGAGRAGPGGRAHLPPHLDPPQVLSCKGMTTLLFSEKPALRAVFGAASAAARGSISGDAVQQFCSPTAAQMILCDGMGTGTPGRRGRQPGRRADGPAAQGGLHRRAGGTAGERGAGPEKRGGERRHPRPHQRGPLHRHGTAVQGRGRPGLSGRTAGGRGPWAMPACPWASWAG